MKPRLWDNYSSKGMIMPEANTKKHAVERFLKSMNCSQAILETYAPALGMSVEVARRVSAALAGGMGMGAECGALTGALLVIGLKYGKTQDTDQKADQETFKRVTEFVKEFQARNKFRVFPAASYRHEHSRRSSGSSPKGPFY